MWKQSGRRRNEMQPKCGNLLHVECETLNAAWSTSKVLQWSSFYTVKSPNRNLDCWSGRAPGRRALNRRLIARFIGCYNDTGSSWLKQTRRDTFATVTDSLKSTTTSATPELCNRCRFTLRDHVQRTISRKFTLYRPQQSVEACALNDKCGCTNLSTYYILTLYQMSWFNRSIYLFLIIHVFKKKKLFKLEINCKWCLCEQSYA